MCGSTCLNHESAEDSGRNQTGSLPLLRLARCSASIPGNDGRRSETGLDVLHGAQRGGQDVPVFLSNLTGLDVEPGAL